MDANGDVFVADSYNNAVKEIPYSGGAYGTPVVLGSGFSYPLGVAVDANGNVFVADTKRGEGSPLQRRDLRHTRDLWLGTLQSRRRGGGCAGRCVRGRYGNNAVKEIPYSGGAYGTPVALGSGFSYPTGVAVDGNGDVFVADTNNSAVKEIPYSGGAYGAPVIIGSGFSDPNGVAVDAAAMCSWPIPATVR